MKYFKNIRTGNTLEVNDEATAELMAKSPNYEEAKPKAKAKKPKDEDEQPKDEDEQPTE